MRLVASALVVFTFWSVQARAQTFVTPVADATIFYPNVVQHNLAIIVLGSSCGAIEFGNFKSNPFRSIQLSLNVYALPLFTSSVDVYGYDRADGLMTADDCGRGTYLGTWVLPDLDFYEETHFDVTDFVHSAKGDFFGFSLHAQDGPVVFSSLEVNYGVPPRLVLAHRPAHARGGRGLTN